MGKHPPPPPHLEARESELFTRIQQEYGVEDSAGLALLGAACESAGRARRCRERIDSEGELTAEGKMHPLLTTERDARRAFVATLAALGLDIQPAGQVGAPVGNVNRLQRVK